MKAVTAAQLALAAQEDAKICLDTIINAMKGRCSSRFSKVWKRGELMRGFWWCLVWIDTAVNMHGNYKETSMGGLAVSRYNELVFLVQSKGLDLTDSNHPSPRRHINPSCPSRLNASIPNFTVLHQSMVRNGHRSSIESSRAFIPINPHQDETYTTCTGITITNDIDIGLSPQQKRK